MKTLVGILNWNNHHLTIQCYETVKKMKGDYDVVVFDNNSDYTERRSLAAYAKENGILILREEEVTSHKLGGQDVLVLLNKNYGYAKPNNIGLCLGWKNGYKYYFLLNNDVFVSSETLGVLIKSLSSSKEAAIVGPKIQNKDKTYIRPVYTKSYYDIIIKPIIFPFVKVLEFAKDHLVRDKGLDEAERFVYSVSGCCMLMDCHKVNKVQGFDEKTFLYAEESILAEKLKIEGFKIKYCPKTEVLHLHGETTKLIPLRSKRQAMIKSNKYYLYKYRGYNKLNILLYMISRSVFDFLWLPVIGNIKKIINKNSNDKR